KINIKTEREHLSIRFLNDGNHILENEQEYLFIPFFRAANSHVSSGFGIGLPIAKKIADYHHATISYFISDDGLNAFEVVF
ncbi:MAG TPA: ATP-binding protein, partial [Chitinophagales bacterium]